MGNIAEKLNSCINLNKINVSILFKKLIALLVVFSITLPQNLFANSPTDGDGNKNELSQERLDFQRILTPAVMNEIGVAPDSIQTINTTGVLNGLKTDIDLIRGEFESKDFDKFIKILKKLEPQIRRAYELDPSTKFQFLYASGPNEKEMRIEAQEVLNLLSDIEKNISVTKETISLERIKKMKDFFVNAFDQTSKSDIYWALARLAFGGSSATLSFYVGSQLPLPASMFLGYAVLGAGSGGIGLFIEKFTGWLDNNTIDPTKPRTLRSRISSVESFMFMSPLLIGLQDTGVFTVEGAGLMAGTAGAVAVIQNVYYMIKRKSPHAAMWYKWYATEAAFLTAPYLIAPAFDIYAENLMATVSSTFLTSLFSTASQGVWDVFITNIRKPYLEAAMRKDAAELANRLQGIDITKIDPRELDRITKVEENKVRERFKKYYFFASIWSVTSAVTSNTGVYMGIPALIYAGTGGLAVLGASGVTTWAYVKYRKNKNSRPIIKSNYNVANITSEEFRSESRAAEELIRAQIQLRTCSMLFSF